jgi:hypothetical protein
MRGKCSRVVSDFVNKVYAKLHLGLYSVNWPWFQAIFFFCIFFSLIVCSLAYCLWYITLLFLSLYYFSGPSHLKRKSPFNALGWLQLEASNSIS